VFAQKNTSTRLQRFRRGRRIKNVSSTLTSNPLPEGEEDATAPGEGAAFR
jgi:hypothetical protein